jgi:hypothetical protein
MSKSPQLAHAPNQLHEFNLSSRPFDGFIWFFFTIPPCSALAIFPFFAINSEEYLLSNCPHSKILLSTIVSQRIRIEVPHGDNRSHVIGNDYIYISVLLLQSLTRLSVPFTVACTFESRVTPLTFTVTAA